MQQVTELAAYRAMRQRPMNDVCRWSEAIEQIAVTHLRLAFAWQRCMLRALTDLHSLSLRR